VPDVNRETWGAKEAAAPAETENLHPLATGRPAGEAVRLGRRCLVRAGAGAVAAATAGVTIPTTGLAQATPMPSEPAIPPIVWELVAYAANGGEPVAIDDPARYTLQFLPNGELLARLDCNQGRGGYTAVDGVLSVTPLAATRAACPPGSHDTDFLRLLLAATSYGFDADGLLLLSGDQGVLTLRPAAGAS
jgi:heat shock protein HslJ